MADVDMPDAGPSAPAKSKGIIKSAKSGADVGSDGKKRFEVKKVIPPGDLSKGKKLMVDSGMLSLCGLGISSSTTVPFAETTSWTSVSSGRPYLL